MTHRQIASPCEECGYNDESPDRAQIPSAVASLADEHRLVLGSVPQERLRAHPRPASWSALEYGCHVRDVLRFQRERVALAQSEEAPPFASMRPEERAVRERYNDQDPLVVADGVVIAARLFSQALEALDDRGWERTGIYPWPAPEVRTVEWVARWTAHELAHHLFDNHRLLGSS